MREADRAQWNTLLLGLKQCANGLGHLLTSTTSHLTQSIFIAAVWQALKRALESTPEEAAAVELVRGDT